MSYTNTALLGLIEPVTGTESGVWGDDISLGLTSYVDIAIAGTNNITTDGDVTLTITTGTYAGSGITSTTAQYAILNCTGARTALRNINAPNSSKIYSVINNTTGGYNLIVRGSTGPTTGVTILNGERCIIAWDTVVGDFVKLASDTVVGLIGTLPVPNGGTGVTTLSGLVYGNGTSAVTTATAAQIVAAIGTTPVAIATTATTATTATSATTATTATNIANGSANQLVYQTASGTTSFATAPTVTGTVLGWTGTNFSWVAAPAATTASAIAGGAQYQIPFQSAVSTTTFSANLTFNSSTNTFSTTNITATTALSGNTVSATASVSAGTTLTAGTSISAGTTITATNGITGSTITANGSIASSSTTGAFNYGTLSYSDINIVGSYVGSANTYVQKILQNKSNGSAASVDFIVSNDQGTANTYYGDYGINSSGFTGTGSFNLPNVVYLYSVSSDLVVGTQGSTNFRVVTNNNAVDAITVNPTNSVAFNGQYGTAGYILTSGGSSGTPAWVSPTSIGTTEGKLYFFGQF